VAARDLPIVGDSFNVGYRFQRHWDTPMANAFFFGELGAGLFLVSLLFSFAPGMLAGLMITGFLKTFFHLSHMGVPAKSWRAIIRPDRSWISRGLLGIVFLIGFGGAHLLITWFDLQTAWGLSPALVGIVKLIAGAAALLVMTYQGFAMSHSTAIALWSTGLMPVSSLVYAATSGLMLTLVGGWGGFLTAAPGTRQLLVNAGLVLLLVVSVVLLSLLHAAHHGSPGGRKSVELLTRSFYAKWFYGLTWGAGLVLPAVLLWFAGDSRAAVTMAAAGVLAGYYAFRVLIFKAGVFEPIMSFRP
jgi:formate-dependent nitrite reductase membrane component NrfD